MKRICLLLFTSYLLLGCQPPTPSVDSIATAIEETAIMWQTLEPATATHTEPPPTPTITITPSATLAPEPTVTQSIHPIQLFDDFSRNWGNWIACEACEWKNKALYMGPYPTSGAYQQHFTICKACGLVTHYRMSALITYQDGPSERGYGFLLRWTDDYITTLEITTWQTVYVWKLDLDSGEWRILDSSWTGALRSGPATNHVEVYVRESTLRRSDISVVINGDTIFVVWSEPVDQSPVGFTLFGHALEVSFDDFEFEEFEPYGDPIEFDDVDRPTL